MKSKLNPRQEKFCQIYHKTGNATRSYADAYEVSDTVAASNAWRSLRNDKIKRRLDELTGEAQALSSMSRAEMLDYLAGVIATPAGQVDANSPYCEEIEHKEGGVKLKTVSKLGAIKELNRMLGFYEPEKVEHSVEGEFNAMLKGLMGVKE